MTDRPRRIAVVGSGVAGLTAAYIASRTAEVTLYEADERLGGHADTHDVPEVLPDGSTRTLRIDTGFIVHNPRTYPTLLRLFAELGVPTQASEMSMSIVDDDSDLEWAGALGRAGLFPTSANVRKPRYLGMLVEIPRFHRQAKALLAQDSDERTLREFLADGRFSAYFVRHFMEPVVACVWSCEPEVALDYPARYLFTFLSHHGMLGIFGSPQWRTVTGGSHSYVSKIGAALGDVRLGTKVTSVLEVDGGVEVTDGSGAVSSYDAVVVATHPGQALSLLAEPTALQRELLSAMPYSPNTALLHTDTSLLPGAEGAWASWNFRRPGVDVPRPTDDGVVVTYDLTRLQRLDTETHYLVTLGGDDLVDPATVIDRMEYEHPLYNPVSVAAQQRLAEIDTDRVVFAGAYHGWGFHEDGARSGRAAVDPPRARVAAVGRTRARCRAPDRDRHLRHHDQPHPPGAVQAALHAPLAHLAGRPRRPARPRLPRPLRGARPPRRPRRVPPRQRRGLPALPRRRGRHRPHPDGRQRARVRLLLQPDQRLLVLGRGRRARRDRRGGAQHLRRPARLPRAPRRAGPCLDAQGDVRLAVPRHRRHLRPGRPGARRPAPGRRRPHTDDGARFSASLRRRPQLGARRLRAAPAALRGSLLIRAHGIWLWLRRLPVRPRPHHHQEGVR